MRTVGHCRRPPRARLLLIVSAISVLLLPQRARAGDPNLRWRTLKTKHFAITFALRDLRAAKRVAVLCEGAHALLVPFMRHTPKGRTRVLLSDYTDGANGWAMVIPRNVMNLFLSAPDSMSTLNDIDDWLFGLIAHEYTHVLHLDTIGGISKLVNWIFGKTLAPNHLQPTWWIEGMAVYNESRFTSGGRNRNNLYDMYLRMAVLEGDVQSLGEISSAPFRFPGGTTSYLYGSRFLKYLASRFGEKKLVKISHDYGRQWLPYGINKIARRYLEGKGYVRLYREWQAHLRRRYTLQARGVRRRGETKATRLTQAGEYTFWPRFHPGGKWLVISDDDGYSDRAFKRLDLKTGKLRKLIRLEPGGSPSFTPDGRRIVYGQMETYKSVYDFTDLFSLDLVTLRARRLTHALRAREPDVSPDGRTIACVVNVQGTTHLALLPMDGLPKGKRPRILVRSRTFDQVSTPAWSPDGRSIVYSAWKQGGHRDLYLVTVASGRVRRLMEDRALDLTPTWSPDGKTIYFSSDRTGIYNVYALDVATGGLKQVTNVVAGALQPAVSPDGKTLAYIGFTSKGYDLYRMKLEPKRFLAALPYVNDRPAPRTFSDRVPRFEIRKYNPLLSLYPESWWFIFSAAPGSESLTLTLSGSDIAALHSWNLSAGYNFATQGVSAGLAYSYAQLWPTIGLAGTYSRGPRGGLTIDGLPETYTEQSVLGQLTLSLPVLRSRRFGSGTIRLHYRVQHFGPVGQEPIPRDPSAQLTYWPEKGLLSNVGLRLSYSQLYSYRYSVSPERGRSLGISVSVNSEQLGADFHTVEVSWWWVEYLPMPWLRNHVLALRLAGGISRGNLARRGIFALGGLPDQDFIQSLVDQAPVGGAYLRGYPTGALWGDQYHLFNAEYRFPIAWLNWAPWTVPLYFRRLSGAVFVDVGHAFFGEFTQNTWKDFRVGVGAELLLDMIVGYYQWLSFRLGYAYGAMAPGGHTFHFLFGVPF
ncbi:MAG: BamA/TamA family outer membrane protein [bacterium]